MPLLAREDGHRLVLARQNAASDLGVGLYQLQQSSRDKCVVAKSVAGDEDVQVQTLQHGPGWVAVSHCSQKEMSENPEETSCD